ncbi:MAG TPA: 50S ribosomal protein L5 [Armatimonadetes bacterium]|nr:50S ribosomal protein L5 [Armatimonadota bacterium]
MARLKERYEKEIIPALQEEFGYHNVMEVPRVTKVVVNVGVGDATQDRQLLDAAMRELAMITGQKPKVTRAKKSVSAFRVRAGNPIGCLVTLRGRRMYEFLDRLFNAALPRIRDFRGLSPRAFDGRGNYTIGIREQLIFPEVDLDQVVRIRGMEVTIVTTAKTDREAMRLLQMLGLPLREA